MTKIFISYSHDDVDFVNKLANDLMDRGYDVWMDIFNLAGGVQWEEKIMQGIDECQYFLLVWTANIESSDVSLKEKKRAIQGGKTVIPLMRSGDPGRMWGDIKVVQWIDFRGDFDSGWSKLIAQVPLGEGVQPPPTMRSLIQQGDMTFRSASRLWRSKFPYITSKGDINALLLDRSEYGIQTYLVGYSDHIIAEPEEIQVYLHFSGTINQERFEEYLKYIAANQRPLWTILVRGPIVATSRGLEYTLPPKEVVWRKAVNMAWDAVSKNGGDMAPLHLYINGPVALGAAFCAREHFRRKLFIYQLGEPNDAKRYFPAYTL